MNEHIPSQHFWKNEKLLLMENLSDFVIHAHAL